MDMLFVGTPGDTPGAIRNVSALALHEQAVGACHVLDCVEGAQHRLRSRVQMRLCFFAIPLNAVRSQP